MERFIAHTRKDADLWQEQPRFRVHLNEPFRPFTVNDFTEHNFVSPDFFIALPFALEHIGTGQFAYQRHPRHDFDPGWIIENAATPVGPVSLSYQFRIEGNSMKGRSVSPIELVTTLYIGDTDYHPPDQLITFPNYDCSVLGRFERVNHSPDLPPQAKYRFFLLPQQKKVETLYLPENPKILSDVTVTFLDSDSQ